MASKVAGKGDTAAESLTMCKQIFSLISLPKNILAASRKVH